MRLLAIPTLILVQLLAPARSPAATLEQVLATMDKVASSFRDMSAKLTRVDHTAVINDNAEESGSVRMKRSGRDMGMVIDFGEPDPRTVVFEKAKIQIYNPKIQTVTVYDLGKQRALVDQFLLLGFGTSSAELRKSYSLKATGEETVSGEPTTRIELVPLTASVLQYLTKAELWISAAGCPMRQKFYRPSGDYTLFTYKDLQLNPGLSGEALAPKFPKGVKYEYPQK